MGECPDYEDGTHRMDGYDFDWCCMSCRCGARSGWLTDRFFADATPTSEVKDG